MTTTKTSAKPEPHMDLARRIVSGGNIVEALDQWARNVTREERLASLTRTLKPGEIADETRKFWLAEGEAAYLEAAEAKGLRREDALRRYAKQEAF